MKTRWGSCNTTAKRIWVNLELAKKNPTCLEYIIVHEMVHLLERLHNERFISYMDKFFPNWRSIKRNWNRLILNNQRLHINNMSL
jgi:predicted metal-dependent hydrolase